MNSPSYINNLPIIHPSWPAPQSIRAYTTTRQGGVSTEPFDSFNLSLSNTDNKEHTQANRALLVQKLALPEPPRWLSQTHSTHVICADTISAHCPVQADASFTANPEIVCAVMTADCLPLLVCNHAGTKVAAIHAGWRGLLNGIIERSIQALDESPQSLFIWLGPAISANAFEVGSEVYEAFCQHHPEAKLAFHPSHRSEHFLADLYHLARIRLHQLKIPAAHIYGGDYCTYTQESWFYSYRRDQENSGRMASLIWRIST